MDEVRDAKELSTAELAAMAAGVSVDTPPAAASDEAYTLKLDDNGEVTFEIPGHTITMKRPPTLLALRIAKWLGVQSGNMMLTALYRALAHVSKIDGEPVVANTEGEINQIAQTIGNEGCDAVLQVWQTFWGIYTPTGLPSPDLPK